MALFFQRASSVASLAASASRSTLSFSATHANVNTDRSFALNDQQFDIKHLDSALGVLDFRGVVMLAHRHAGATGVEAGLTALSGSWRAGM